MYSLINGRGISDSYEVLSLSVIEKVKISTGLLLTPQKCNTGTLSRISIPTSQVPLFFEIIGECPVPSMQYKWKVRKEYFLMSQLYRCCKANDPRCPGCQHDQPHERWSKTRFLSKDKDVCTEYAKCNDKNGEELPFKVRCVKIK